MIYLILAIFGSSALVILLKIFELKGVNLYLGIAINYVVAAALSYTFSPAPVSWDAISGAPWFVISLITGVVFMIGFVIYSLSAQRFGVAITTISGRAAVVIPVLFAFIFLGESVTAIKLSMFALILLSMVLILRKKEGENSGQKRTLWLALLPVLVFLSNGVCDTLVQYSQKTMVTSSDLVPAFMGTMFVAGAISGVLLYIVSLIKTPHRPTGRDLLWGGALGVVNWICMIASGNALKIYDGSIFYPLYYCGAIVVSTVVGIVVFHEKLSVINYIGIAIALIAIAVISMQ